MIRIYDEQRLNYYVNKYNIDAIFTENMREYMEFVLFNKNEYICKVDEELKYFYFFIHGKAKVYTSLSNGKSLLLGFYTPFKIIGDVEFMKHKFAISNMQVIEESYCIAIPMEILKNKTLEDCKFLRFICTELGEKLNTLSNYSSINLLYPLENRLASYILVSTSYSENEGESNITFQGNLTEISELLGTSYRHLLRVLNKLCTLGAIKKNEGNYEITNIQLLETLAGDLYK